MSSTSSQHPDAERHLLFGILARQLDFITRDALAKALKAWARDKSKPLGWILRDDGALPADLADLVDVLMHKHLERHDNSPEKSLAALASLQSDWQEMLQNTDTELQATLSIANDHSRVHDCHAPTEDSSFSTLAGRRFEILRSHAKGGLGEVFVAHDRELDREVALKKIQDCHADSARSKARFILEAEITGSLEHPGIVPVYSLGRDEAGLPFYAMRFIQGDRLKDAIDHYHRPGQSHPSPGERALELRQLLTRFIDVCQAISYAHSRGILHRDVKPDNIMLGQFGESLVVDWGLAKLVGRSDADAAGSDRPPRSRSTDASTLTEMGVAMGTPQFMSPEQAAGRIQDLGPASDVYSLGATLYCLLTGGPPFDSEIIGDVLKKVERGAFPAPRKINPDVPAALEAICLKAMACSPGERYPSVRLLAEDVEHWLADEPVQSYRESMGEQTTRWMRGHRTIVAGALATLVVTAAAFAIATALLSAANDRERQAKIQAEDNERLAQEQRDHAAERFQLARAAVDQFYTRVSESQEMKAQGVERLRTHLLEMAAQFYEKLVRAETTDPSLEAERGRGYRRLAELYRSTGKAAEAEAAAHNAVDIHRRLVAGDTVSMQGQLDLADSLLTLGNLLKATGRREQAQEALANGLSQARTLASTHPEMDECQMLLIKACQSMGNLYFLTGRFQLAEPLFKEALELSIRLASAHPSAPENQESVSRNYTNLGTLYINTLQYDRAEAALKGAITASEKLALMNPESLAYENLLARSYNALGAGLPRSGIFRLK